MEKADINISSHHHKILEKKELIKEKAIYILKLIFVYTVGLMLGRAVIFTNLNPMAMGFFASVYIDKKSRLWIFLSVLTGLLTVMPVIDSLKYVLIMIIIVSVNSIIEIKGNKVMLIHEAVIASSSSLFVTLLAAIIRRNVLNNLYIGLLESIAIFSLVLIYGRGLKYILEQEEEKKVTNEILISEAIIMGTAVAGIAGVTVLGIGFIEIWIFSVVLILGYRHGIGTGSVVGVISGIVLVLMGSYEASIIGIFGMVGILKVVSWT